MSSVKLSSTFSKEVYIVSANFSNRMNFPLGVFVSLSCARELFQILVRLGFVGVTLSKTELHD